LAVGLLQLLQQQVAFAVLAAECAQRGLQLVAVALRPRLGMGHQQVPGAGRAVVQGHGQRGVQRLLRCARAERRQVAGQRDQHAGTVLLCRQVFKPFAPGRAGRGRQAVGERAP